MQVFSTLNSARHATDRMRAFFEDMRDHSPQSNLTTHDSSPGPAAG